MAVAGVAILAATGIALLNVRFGAIVTGAFLAVEGIALAILTMVAALHPVRSLPQVILHPVMLSHGALVQTPLSVLALAAVSGLWATAGASWALYFAEEMHEVRQKIGRVIAWMGALAALTIAGPMVLMVLGAGDLKTILGAEAPIAVFLTNTGGPVLANVVSLGVVAAIFNAMIANVMAYGRFLYSTGRDGMWVGPINRFLATLHPKTGAPVAATLILAVMSIGVMFIGEKALIIFLSGNVSDYLLVSLAILVGRAPKRRASSTAPRFTRWSRCLALASPSLR